MFQYVAWGNAVNMTASTLSHLELPGAEVWPPARQTPACSCAWHAHLIQEVSPSDLGGVKASNSAVHRRLLVGGRSVVSLTSEADHAVQAAATDVGRVLCQHGPLECQLNRVINCATDAYPDQNQWCVTAARDSSATSAVHVSFTELPVLMAAPHNTGAWSAPS